MFVIQLAEKIAGTLTSRQKAMIEAGPCVIYKDKPRAMWKCAPLNKEMLLNESAKEKLDMVARNHGFDRWERDSITPNAYIIALGLMVRY